MSSSKNRMIILVTVLVTIASMLACSTSSLLSRQEPTATPTKTPKPTFTTTSTPTQTPLPTDTPLPTATPTPLPPPTNTPIVMTATFTPMPTDTPVPPTNTPKPTRKPQPPKPTATATKKPGPTNTPKPSFPFTGTITGGTVNCGTTGVKGRVKTNTGGGYAGVTVAVWTDGWEGTVANPADAAGNWNVLLWDQGPRPGTWYAAVVKADACQRRRDGSLTAQGCEPQSNRVTVVTTLACTGEGAVQWPEIEFRQN